MNLICYFFIYHGSFSLPPYFYFDVFICYCCCLSYYISSSSCFLSFYFSINAIVNIGARTGSFSPLFCTNQSTEICTAVPHVFYFFDNIKKYYIYICLLNGFEHHFVFDFCSCLLLLSLFVIFFFTSKSLLLITTVV